MKRMTVKEIVKATGGRLLFGDEKSVVESVSIDSRDIKENALFVPLIGERSDGHDFIEKAFLSGASVVITQKDISAIENKAAVMVEDTAKALGDIAKYYKKRFNIKTIAVTGSVGKTTTKDMLASVMNTRYNTLKTEGNYNNEIGLPLTVLRMEEQNEAAVFEMGMSAFGEIHYLADIVRPDVGIITNIGMSHIENLGSQEGIYKAKTEICDFFNEKSLLIVNGDDKFLKKAKEFKNFNVVTCGIESDCDYKAENIEDLGINGTRFTVKFYGRQHEIFVKVPGVHNVYNALAAIACGVYYDISPNRICEGIENFSLTGMRMAVERAQGYTIINDCYNSSPDSVNAALRVLSTQKTRRVAILGDILEMGEYAREAHFKLGKAVYKNGTDVLLTAGENARYMVEGAKKCGMENAFAFENTEALASEALKYLKDGDSVLVKASRGMHFEKIVEALKMNRGE